MNNSQYQKNRIEWIDTAKGIGIILVFLGHADFEPFSKIIYMFHIPLFFFISGFLFHFNEDDNFKSFSLKKIKSIIIPYFSYGIVLSLYALLKIAVYPFLGVQLDSDSFVNVYRVLIIQDRYTTLWYLATLWWNNIFLFIMLKNVKNIKAINSLITIFAVAWLIYFKLGGGSLPWDIDVASTTLPFFYCGYLSHTDSFNLRKKYGNVLSKNNIKYGCIFWIIGLLVGTIGYEISGETLDIFWNIYACEPLTYIAAFFGIFGAICFSKVIHSKWIQYIGRYSIIYFALHQSIVFDILNIVFSKMNIWQGSLPLYSIILKAIFMTLTTVILLTFLNEVLKRHKFAEVLFGLKYQPS